MQGPTGGCKKACDLASAEKYPPTPNSGQEAAIQQLPFSTGEPGNPGAYAHRRTTASVSLTRSAAGYYRLAVSAHGETVSSSQTYETMADAMAAAYRLAW